MLQEGMKCERPVNREVKKWEGGEGMSRDGESGEARGKDKRRGFGMSRGWLGEGKGGEPARLSE